MVLPSWLLLVSYTWSTDLNAFNFCQGYYDTSDDGVMDEDGFVSIMARTDDVINVAGHRISTKALEEVSTNFSFCLLVQKNKAQGVKM